MDDGIIKLEPEAVYPSNVAFTDLGSCMIIKH